jgi:hypothetical protein
MKNKKWVLLLIIAFPSFIWLLLETSTINSRKLPFYGPKTLLAAGDTLYHQVQDSLYQQVGHHFNRTLLDRTEFPLFVAMFADEKYEKDNYRIEGLLEYLQYKYEKVQPIPFVFITEFSSDRSKALTQLHKLKQYENIHFYSWPKKDFKKLTETYFASKPYYIDYSFLVLVDPERHVRGFYDARYVSEIKRLIEEYQHLRLKEEKLKLIESNEIKTTQ